MKDIKWIFVFYALAAVLAMCFVGFSIGSNSFLGAMISIIALIFIMGNGFKTKKKMREAGTL